MPMQVFNLVVGVWIMEIVLSGFDKTKFTRSTTKTISYSLVLMLVILYTMIN